LTGELAAASPQFGAKEALDPAGTRIRPFLKAGRTGYDACQNL